MSAWIEGRKSSRRELEKTTETDTDCHIASVGKKVLAVKEKREMDASDSETRRKKRQ